MSTVLVDFDGTIYSYISGWHGTEVLPDPPMPGAKEAIAEIKTRHEVVVHSTRAMFPGGKEAIEAWLEKHGIEVDGVGFEKGPHIALIDDRAIHFGGCWDEAMGWLSRYETGELPHHDVDEASITDDE